MGGDSAEVSGSEAQRFCLQEWDWLVKTCQETLWRQGFPNTQEHARDLAQEVYLKCAPLAGPRWAAINEPRAYVAKIIFHLVNAVERHERATEPDVLAHIAEAHQPHTPAKTMEAAILVRELMSKLSDDERLLFELWFYQELPSKEIARRLDTGDEAMRKRLERLRKRLQALLTTEDRFP